MRHWHSALPAFIKGAAVAVFGTLGTAAAAQVAATPPTFEATLDPTTISPGGIAQITYTIAGQDAPATALSFTDTLPANMSFAAPANPQTDCRDPRASTDLSISGTQITLTDGAVAANDTCTVTVDVTASVSADSHVTGSLTSSLGNSGTALVPALSVDTTEPSFTMSFAPSTVNAGTTTTLTYLIDNDTAAGISNLDFEHTLPASLRIADAPNASTTCSSSFEAATLTAAPGGSVIALDANGFAPSFPVLAAGATCTVSVDITAFSAGEVVTTTDFLLVNFNPTTRATALLTVQPAAAQVSISKLFLTNPVAAGGTTNLRFRLRNVNRTESVTSVAFSDILSDMLAGTTVSSVVGNDCGGTTSGVGTGTFGYSGGTLGPDGLCDITIAVAIPGGAAPTTYTNTTSGVSGTYASGGVTGDPATTTLNVLSGFPSLSFTISDADIGGQATIEFTLTNSGMAAATTDAAFNLNFGTNLPGNTGVSDLPTNPCGGGTLQQGSFDFGGSTGFAFTGGSLAASGNAGDSCTFSATIDIPANAAIGSVTLTSDAPTASYGAGTVTGTPGSDTFVIGGGIEVALSKSFGATSAIEGADVGLTFNLRNSSESTADATDLSFSDNLGVFYSGTVLKSVDSNDCGGTVDGVGDGLIEVAGASLDIGASCIIETTITLGADGATTATNTAGPVFNEPGNLQVSGPATAELRIRPAETVAFSKEFVGSPASPGAAISLRYTLENLSGTDPASISFFTDNLNGALTGMVTDDGVSLQNTCGGTPSGTTNFFYVGGTIAAGGTCVIEIPLTIPDDAADGPYPSTSGSLTVTIGGGAAQSVPGAFDRLVIDAQPLVFGKAFAAPEVDQGGSVDLVFTIDNAGAATVTDIAFSDDLATMLSGATFGPALQYNGSCGTPSSGGTNTNEVTFDAITVAAGSTCLITATVEIPADAELGPKTNVTSALTGLIGTGIVGADPARTRIRVTDPDELVFAQAFVGPSTATGTVGLEVTISNPSSVAVTDLSFTQDLSGALTGLEAVGFGPVPCGPSSGLVGTSFLTFSGGSLAPNSSCTFFATLQVPAGVAPGTYPVLSSKLFQGGVERADPASPDLVIEPAPAFAQAFSPATILQGGTSTLTYTVDNTASVLAASALSFSNNLPAGVVIASPANNSSTCTGGMGSFPVGSGSISYAGGSVGAGASCTVQVDVTATAVGSYVNTSGDLTSSSGNSGTSSDTLTVDPAPVPLLTLAASPTAVEIGTASTITLTIDNTAAGVPAENIAIRIPNDFGVNAIPAQPFGFTTTCGGAPGTVSGGSGGAPFVFSGYSVPAGQSCTFSTDIIPLLTLTRDVRVDNVSSTLGNSGNAATPLTGTAPPAPDYTLSTDPGSIPQGGVSDLVFGVSSNAATVDMAFEINEVLNPLLSLVTPFAPTSTCGATVTNPSAGTVDIVGSLAAGASCEIRFAVTTDVDGTIPAPTRPLNHTYTGADRVQLAAPASSLVVTPAPTPDFGKAFADNSIVQGETTTLSFSIDNSGALVPAEDMLFTDILPSGMTVAVGSTASHTCDAGTLSAVPGGNFIRFEAGQIAAGATCEITATVTAVEVGTANNESSQLQTSLGDAALATASLDVTRAPAPQFSKAFADTPIVQGQITTLTFTIDNTAAAVPATDLLFGDDFPDGVVLTDTPNPATTCNGGTVVASPGDVSTAYAGGGSVDAGAICTVSVDVTSVTVGSYDNVTGQLSSSQGTSDPASATLVVDSAPLPVFTKEFDDTSVAEGVETTLIFTIDNSAALISTGPLFFEDNFPAGMVLAPDPEALSDCPGAAFAFTPGRPGTFQFRASDLPAGDICQVGLHVLSTEAGTAVNVTEELQAGNIGNSPPATASIEITAAPAPLLTKRFDVTNMVQGDVARVTVGIDNQLASLDTEEAAFEDALPTDMLVAAPANAETTCAAGTIDAVSGAGLVTFSGGVVLAGATCEVSFDVRVTEPGAYENTIPALSSSLGVSDGASAALNVTPGDRLVVNKAFAKDAALQGEVVGLTLTLRNPNAFQEAAEVLLTDPLPAGMQLASAPVADPACGSPTLTGSAGDGTLGLSDGLIAPGATCTVTADVLMNGAAVGALVNETTEQGSSLGDSAPALATITVTAAQPLLVVKSFDTDVAENSQIIGLTITLENANAFADATDVQIDDILPDGMVLASAPAVDAACGDPVLTGASGEAAFGLSAGAIAATATCTLTADVLLTGTGDITNTTSNQSSSLGASDPASAAVTVTAPDVLLVTKAFAAEAADQGETLGLTITLENPNGFAEATDVTLDDVFPAGMVLAGAPVADASCGTPTLTGAAGDAGFGFADGAVDAGALCTVTANVLLTGAGELTNVTSNQGSSLGASTAASAIIAVTPSEGLLLTKAFDTDTAEEGQTIGLSITLENTNAFDIATDAVFDDDFPAGMVLASAPVADASCGTPTLTGAAGDAGFGFAGGEIDAGALCTVTANVLLTGAGDLTNVTSNQASSLGDSAAASATVAVTPADVLLLTKAFDTDTAEQGQTIGLTLTLENPNAFLPATDVIVDDLFPAGMLLASVPAASAACGDAVLTGAAGDDSLGLSEGEIAPGATCTVTAEVVLTGTGTLVNTTSNQGSSLGDSAAASASVTAEAAAPLIFGKAFDAGSAVQGETIGLTITIENPNAFQIATEVTFEDPFPAGMELAGAPTADAACGSPVLTGTVGGTLITFAGGTVAPGALCTVTADVLITGAVSATNVTVNQGSALGDSASASPPAAAPLVIIPSEPLDVALAFAPAEIEQTQTSVLTITMSNAAGVEATAIGIRDTLPDGVTLAVPAEATTTCPMGIVSGTDGGSELQLEGATLAAGGSCSVSARVTSAIVGTYDDTVEVQTSSLGTGAAARGALEVIPATTGTVTIVQDTDFDGDFVYSSTLAALNFTITTAGGKGRRGPIQVPVGSHLLSLVAPDGVGNTAISCTDDDSVGDAKSGDITLNIDPLEAVTCTVTSVESRQRTVDAINRFLTKRADLILSSEPSANRRFSRLNRGFGGSRVLNFTNGDLKSTLPFTLKASGGENFQFSTSLVQMQEARANFLMAHDGVDASRRVDNHRFDAWFEAQFKRFDAGSDGAGHFAIAYLGADYLVTEDVLVGALVQIDDMEDVSDAAGSTVRGRGWLAGPYVTARIAPNLYFDGRIAAGRSSNEISPFNTYTDDFDTTRWMATASLTGEFERGDWTIRPSASFSYFEETQDSYVDSLGVSIPDQTVSLGQIKLGPTFTGDFESASGIPYSPYFSLDAIYNMGDTDGVTLTDPDSAATEGWRGRIKAGVDWTSENGSRFSFGGTYDGIGREDFEAWGLTFDVTIPLHKAVAR